MAEMDHLEDLGVDGKIIFIRDIPLCFANTVGYATANGCYNEQFLSIKSGCYNERGETLSADVARACA